MFVCVFTLGGETQRREVRAGESRRRGAGDFHWSWSQNSARQLPEEEAPPNLLLFWIFETHTGLRAQRKPHVFNIKSVFSSSSFSLFFFFGAVEKSANVVTFRTCYFLLLQRLTVEWRGENPSWLKPDDYCKLPREWGAGLQTDLWGGRAAAGRPFRSVRFPVTVCARGLWTKGAIRFSWSARLLSVLVTFPGNFQQRHNISKFWFKKNYRGAKLMY